MKATASSTPWAGPASLALAAIVALFIWAVVAGKKIPFVPGYGQAFLILWILGLTLWIFAGMRDGVPGAEPVLGWTLKPLMVLGIVSFALLVLVPIGNWLRLIHGYQGPFYLLAGIIVVKWVLAHLHYVGLA